ncbi:MAG: hypothetical protein FJ363_12305 [Gemmatimonadetes bacterium]|nr:hypothetical protein [Gemmatimonadota bacterium]
MHPFLRPLLLPLLLLAANPLQAQAARIGRLPVLAPMRAATTVCRALSVNAELRKRGITGGVMAQDSGARRLVSIGTTSSGRVRTLHALMSDSTGPKRSEMESVSVRFDAEGRVQAGTHSAMTGGTPARLSEDRRGGLLPSDTAQAVALAAALLKCKVR